MHKNKDFFTKPSQNKLYYYAYRHNMLCFEVVIYILFIFFYEIDIAEIILLCYNEL